MWWFVCALDKFDVHVTIYQSLVWRFSGYTTGFRNLIGGGIIKESIRLDKRTCVCFSFLHLPMAVLIRFGDWGLKNWIRTEGLSTIIVVSKLSKYCTIRSSNSLPRRWTQPCCPRSVSEDHRSIHSLTQSHDILYLDPGEAVSLNGCFRMQCQSYPAGCMSCCAAYVPLRQEGSKMWSRRMCYVWS